MANAIEFRLVFVQGGCSPIRDVFPTETAAKAAAVIADGAAIEWVPGEDDDGNKSWTSDHWRVEQHS